MDPRLDIISKRLIDIKNVVAVSGAKGGVGKSSVACGLALALSRCGYKVGLMDLDFTCPSAHVILGIAQAYPREANGIIPPDVHGVKFMSVSCFTGQTPSPLRGADVSNVIIELLAITQWGPLDFLIIDMPPGIGDATLDTARLMSKPMFLIVTTRSRVSLEVVKRILTTLQQLAVPVIGIVENMILPGLLPAKTELKRFNVPFVGEIDFDNGLEDTIGDVDKLLDTRFAASIKKIVLNTPEFKVNSVTG